MLVESLAAHLLEQLDFRNCGGGFVINGNFNRGNLGNGFGDRRGNGQSGSLNNSDLNRRFGDRGLCDGCFVNRLRNGGVKDRGGFRLGLLGQESLGQSRCGRGLAERRLRRGRRGFGNRRFLGGRRGFCNRRFLCGWRDLSDGRGLGSGGLRFCGRRFLRSCGRGLADKGVDLIVHIGLRLGNWRGLGGRRFLGGCGRGEERLQRLVVVIRHLCYWRFLSGRRFGCGSLCLGDRRLIGSRRFLGGRSLCLGGWGLGLGRRRFSGGFGGLRLTASKLVEEIVEVAVQAILRKASRTKHERGGGNRRHKNFRRFHYVRLLKVH